MLRRVRTALASRYAVERERGRGATATVYAARDLKHGRRVALKVIEPDVVSTVGTSRFLQEIRTTARLSHPNILPLFDSGTEDGFTYYTMPLVDGDTLRERLDRVGPMPLDAVLPLVAQIADALSYAHAAGIVHRDIKPENILIGEREHVWVADFGLARALTHAANQRLTSTGIAVGSPQYMSPEQAAGESDIDGRSDIYSLACIAFEALCGEPPFMAGHVSSLLARHLAEPAPAIRDRCPGIPPAVDAALRRAMSKDRSHRFRDARDFVAALQSPVDAHGAVVDAPATPTRARIPAFASLRAIFRPRPARQRRTFALVALGVIVAAAGIYLLQTLPLRSAGDARIVAVFPFRTAGVDVLHWSEGVPDLLSSVLDGAIGVVVADPWSLWKSLRSNARELASSPDPERAAELARRSHAQRFVLGSVVDAGDSIQVQARVYDAQSGRPVQTLTAAGVATNLSEIVRDLAVQFLASFATEQQLPALGRIDAGLTQSPEALKAFMLARLSMRRGMVDSAEIAINESLAHDSLFTAAIVEAAVIRSWAQFMRAEPYAGLRELVDRGLARDSLLRERDRLRLAAMDASIRTDGAAAASALHGILAQDSTDLHAWAQLHYVTTVYGWQYGSPESLAMEISDRLLRLDSGYVPMLAARTWQSVSANDMPEYPRLMNLLSADSTSALARANLGCLRAVVASDSAFPALVASAGDSRVQGLGMLRCLRLAHPDRSEALVRIWRASDDPWLSSRGLAEEARMDVSRGRSRSVGARIRAGGLTPDLMLQAQLLIVAASLAHVGDSATAVEAVSALARTVPVDSAAAYFETRPVWWAGWMIAAHSAQFGDTVMARRWQRVLGAFPPGGSPSEWPSALHADIEARLAARRGDTDDALQHARRAFSLWHIHTENSFEAMPEPQMRLHLALLHRSAGHSDSAHALLRSLVPPATWMGFLTARAAFELGVLEEQARNIAAAERYYTVAWNLWSGGNAEIEPWRSQTAQALERTRGSRM